MKHMTIITAQRPVKTVAKDSVASFKVRKGNTLGIMCTLRGKVLLHASLLTSKMFVCLSLCSMI